MKNKQIALTIGDVGGIGPEIIIKALNSPGICAGLNKFLLIGNKNLLLAKASELDLKLDFPENVEISDIPFDISKLVIGKPTVEAGKHSFLALKKACELAQEGKISAIVTAPVSKEAINNAGYYYSGQTEILEEYLRTPEINKLQAEMLFVAENLRVMLLTRHVKLSSVSSGLSIDGIIKSVSALNNSLINDFKLKEPKIAICGLNPHSGENGLLGNEENNLIKPALDKLINKYGISIEGPFPADALWANVAKNYLKGENLSYDAYIACYHDQGLIPVKMLAPKKAINTTINLPVIRTSPSHGTAYDIAGQNTADYQSMTEAINLAILLKK